MHELYKLVEELQEEIKLLKRRMSDEEREYKEYRQKAGVNSYKINEEFHNRIVKVEEELEQVKNTFMEFIEIKRETKKEEKQIIINLNY